MGAAREQVAGMKATQESPIEAGASDADKQQPQPQEQKATEEEEEMPSGEDAEAAAAKVQAYMRGKVAREQVAGMKATQESPSPDRDMAKQSEASGIHLTGLLHLKAHSTVRCGAVARGDSRLSHSTTEPM